MKKSENACVLAGGTDLLGTLKTEILCENPDTLVDIKRIPESKGIKEEDGALTVGALTTLTEIEESPVVRENVPMLPKRPTPSPRPDPQQGHRGRQPVPGRPLLVLPLSP